MVVGVAMMVVLGVAATSVGASTRSRSDEPARRGLIFRSTLIGRPVTASMAVTIRGVLPGGAPWTLTRGRTRLTRAGRLSVDVEGLVITATNTSLDGTTGPVTKVAASLTCEASTPSVVSTATVPLSPEGDARIDERIALPKTCLAPIVLVRANSSSGPWIAATGFESG
jgi:hypothetical protein